MLLDGCLPTHYREPVSMELVHALKRFHWNRQIKSLASQVAKRVKPLVRERLSHAADAMSLSEARGYVRARAGLPVRWQTERMLESHAAPAWLAPEITHLATEHVVYSVTRDLLMQDQSQRQSRKAA